MAESRSFYGKIKDVLVVTDEFTPEGQSESIKYQQVHIIVDFDGEEDKIVIKKENNPADIAKFLKAADEQA